MNSKLKVYTSAVEANPTTVALIFHPPLNFAWTFYLLHGKMQANFQLIMQNSGRIHGNIS